MHSPILEEEGEKSIGIFKKLLMIVCALIAVISVIYPGYVYVRNAPMREFASAVEGVDIEKIADMSNEERKDFFSNMKRIRDKMSDSQKKINDEQNMERMNQQFQEKFNKFFSLTSAEQKAALDKDIDRMMGLMKGFMNGKGAMPFGQPGMKNTEPKTIPNSNQANSKDANLEKQKQKGLSPEQRNKMVSNMLDKSTPEMRAQMTEYWVRINQRFKERGVQLIPFLGGFGGSKAK
ncbi:MAG: hypothetical protein RL595_870 [Planctomycetota bacterium]|jgi:hypothetical protein